MKSETLFRSLLVLAAMSFLVGGCGVGSYQARNVDIKNATLVNPAVLVPGNGDQALYRYVNPKADIKQYVNIIIDPVMVQTLTGASGANN